MGGGGGGYTSFSPSFRSDRVRQSLYKTRELDKASVLASVFNERLALINQVDRPVLEKHKELLLQALRNAGLIAYGLRSAGSYSRHTYVNGLSDVDILLDLGRYSTSNVPGKEDSKVVLRYVQAAVQERLPRTSVQVGRMAVTVHFSDGFEIQVLPAFRYHNGFRLPDPEGTGWVTTYPGRFRRMLARDNASMDGKLVPTIKLAKLLFANARVGLKSYHIENLALTAFKEYVGRRTYDAMLLHFLNRSKTLVLRRVSDVTGQGEYIDSYVDKAGREKAARSIAALEIRLTNADAETWKELLSPL